MVVTVKATTDNTNDPGWTIDHISCPQYPRRMPETPTQELRLSFYSTCIRTCLSTCLSTHLCTCISSSVLMYFYISVYLPYQTCLVPRAQKCLGRVWEVFSLLQSPHSFFHPPPPAAQWDKGVIFSCYFLFCFS